MAMKYCDSAVAKAVSVCSRTKENESRVREDDGRWGMELVQR